MKIIGLILLVVVIISCSNSSNEIIGLWTHIKTIENGKETTDPWLRNIDLKQNKFTKDGEMLYIYDNERYGLGLYYYNLVGDSLYITNVSKDSVGNVDTLGRFGVLCLIKKDTMTIKQDNKTLYYKREKK